MMDTKEARILERASANTKGYSWDNPRVVHLEYGTSFPKFIYIKGANGLLRAFKRKEFDSDGYYNKYKHHEKYDQATGATYAEYEEVDRDILIIEAE